MRSRFVGGSTNLPTDAGQVQMQLQLWLELEHFCELFSHYEQIRFIVKRLGNGRQKEPKESASQAKENGRQTENQPDFGLVLDAFGAYNTA